MGDFLFWGIRGPAFREGAAASCSGGNQSGRGLRQAAGHPDTVREKRPGPRPSSLSGLHGPAVFVWNGGSARAPPLQTVSGSDIQSGVVAPVDGIGDGGNAGGITDDAHKGRAILQFFHDIRTRALPKGRDDAFAGHEYFLPVMQW